MHRGSIAALIACLALMTPISSAWAQEQVSEEPEDSSGPLTVKTNETTLTFGGAVWINWAFQDWKSPDEGRERDLRFDNLRLALDGSYGEQLLFSAQYRFYSYTRAIHHAWFGYRPNENNQIELGVTQVPFGLLPFATHSFWFGLGYYLGLEDDYDAGIKWHRDKGPWDLHLAFFQNEELGDATNLDRFSTDVVRVDDQQNEEVNQGNLRLAYTVGKGTDSSSEFALSGQYGVLDNRNTVRSGDRWAAAAHYKGWYGDWNPEVQVALYEYSPENPEDVDDRLILLGNLTSTRLVAAEGTLVNLNLRRFFEVDWGPFEKFNAYVNYSHLFKDEDAFLDSQLFDAGCVFEAGPFWIWVDFLLGRNAWYLNDSPENSGMGPGGTDDWEFRLNVNFEWFF